jgi:hypothetical protein
MAPLTEERVREVFREFAALSARHYIVQMTFAAAGLEVPEPAQGTEEELDARSAHAVETMSDDQARIISIVRLIALIGADEARVQAGPLSVYAQKNWRSIRNQPWKYTLWEYALRLAAVAGEGPTPVLPEEVDAVARALDEILPLNPQVYQGYHFEKQRAAQLNADPESHTRRAGVKPRNVEARKWLSRKTNPPVLAGNRFGTTTLGLAFVEELYAAGAKSVMVAGDTIDLGSDDMPDHSDTLIVRLPKDPEARSRLLTITNREAAREGMEEEPDEGQGEVRLWWD